MPKNSKTPVVAEQVAEQLANAETLSIKEAVLLSGLSEVYIRRAMGLGKFKVTKGTVGTSKTPKNFIDRASFDAWRASASHTKREDGRNKFNLYLTEEEREKLAGMIADLEFANTLQRANMKREPVAETE